MIKHPLCRGYFKQLGAELPKDEGRWRTRRGIRGIPLRRHEQRHQIELDLTTGNRVLAGDRELIGLKMRKNIFVSSDAGIEKRISVCVAMRVDLLDNTLEG